MRLGIGRGWGHPSPDMGSFIPEEAITIFVRGYRNSDRGARQQLAIGRRVEEPVLLLLASLDRRTSSLDRHPWTGIPEQAGVDRHPVSRVTI